MAVPDAIQTAFITLRTAVDAMQATYSRVGRRRYWQGQRTAGNALARTIAPDDSWASVGLAPPAGLTVRVDYYGGPLGDGWVVIGTYTDLVTGEVWERRANTGPEPWRRTAGWVLLPASIP